MRKINFTLPLFVMLFAASMPLFADAAIPHASNSKNEQVILSLFSAFNRHDIDTLASLYAPDAYLMSSDFTSARHGPEGVRQTYVHLFSQLPNIHDEVKTMIVKGDEGAVEFTSTWAAMGEMPAGKLEIATFFKFKDGKIISDITYFNVPKSP